MEYQIREENVYLKLVVVVKKCIKWSYANVVAEIGWVWLRSVDITFNVSIFLKK